MEEKLRANFNKTEQLQIDLLKTKAEIDRDIVQKILKITTDIRGYKQVLED